jgi:hypothetical protein
MYNTTIHTRLKKFRLGLMVVFILGSVVGGCSGFMMVMRMGGRGRRVGSEVIGTGVRVGLGYFGFLDFDVLV